MKRMLSHRPSAAMMVAMTALFVALGGVSYAAVKLPKNSVGTNQIRKNAVTSAKIKNSTIVGADVRNSSLTSADIKNRSLLAVDFRLGQLPRGPRGFEGPQGPAGPAGAPGLSALQLISGLVDGGSGSHSSTATCPSGKKAISGGYNTTAIDSSSNLSITFAAITDDGNSYRVDGRLDDNGDNWNLTARALCATVAS